MTVRPHSDFLICFKIVTQSQAVVSWWDMAVWVKWYLWPRQLLWRGHVIQIITAFHTA